MGVAAKSRSRQTTRTAAVKAPRTSKFAWDDLPAHTVPNTSAILGGSVSRTYGLINKGELEAMHVAGKTLIKTSSIIKLLEKGETGQWAPYRDRVEKAVAARPDVARKRARTASSTQTKDPA
jgi:hypothetical protein